MDPALPPPAARRRGLLGLVAAQALGSFNDNALKTLVALLAAARLPGAASGGAVALAGAAFVLPFLALSTYAGWAADRFEKGRLLVWLKAAEVALLLLAFPALAWGGQGALLAYLALLGAHAAFVSPVKLAVIPELVEEEGLSRANGLVQMTGFLGILLGTLAAGFLIEAYRDRIALALLPLLAAAAAGWAAALLIPARRPPGDPGPLEWNAVRSGLSLLGELSRQRGVFLATVGSAYFWFAAALFQMNLLAYGRDLLGFSEEATGSFQVLAAVGIALGSWAAGRLSSDQIELGLVPLGALGLVLFSLDLAFAFRQPVRAMADVLGLGAAAGAFVIPLQALIQQRSPPERLGRIVAAGNLLSLTGILAASACLYGTSAFFGLHPGQVFLVAGLMTAAVAAYLVAMLPDALIRMVLYPVAHGIYRIRAVGRERLPREGGALLVSNHVSFIDAFLIAMASPRPVRFLMFRSYYDIPVARTLFAALRCIPISDRDGPKELIESLRVARAAVEAGEVVCIFAEGEISRHGQMLRFKKGFERIVDGLTAPVVPVHLDQVWGSVFSFSEGRALWKLPRRIPYPVTVSFGAPMPAASDAFAVRQAILELAAEAFRHRLEGRGPLGLSFLREVRRAPWRLAVADSSGASTSRAGLLLKASALALALEAELGPEQMVGLLLPPSVPAAAANAALALMGRVAVNLNYTASRDIVEACARKAGIARVLTARRFTERLGWEPSGALYLEDLAARAPRARALLSAAVLLALPRRLAEATLPAAARGPLDGLATVIFTSGSTGVPKGVMLTHANILSNIEALRQLYALGPGDKVLGVLPFFHSFGFTGTLWLPLLTGMGAVFHHNPLEAKRVGELAERFRPTFLVGTPTFLTGYVRRVEPGQFSSLKTVVVGAEKLREDAAEAFEARFGLRPLEGYGCTELSPVAAVNIPDIDWPGVRQKGAKPGSVGHPLPGVIMKVVDPETGRELSAGQPGLLLVKGPNVMKGYLGDEALTREAVVDGFYRTGDIAEIDADGFVTITDRLSRFSKLAGEMVPHIKLEEALHTAAGTVEQTFVVTGVPDAARGERLVVLYKGERSPEALRKKLLEAGLPKLWIPAAEDFRRVDGFPLLGSGKLDLTALKAKARELAAAKP